MCMNCGCGELDTRHKETDLVSDDVRRAAEGQSQPVDQTIGNLEAALQQLRTTERTSTAQAGSMSGMRR